MQKATQQFASQYGLDTMVFFRKNFEMEAVLYNKIDGTTIQRCIDFREIGGTNTLLKHLDIALSKAATIKQTKKYKFYERELRWAEVLACRPSGDLLVEAEIIPGEQVIAVCPLNRIGLHERNLQSFGVGRRRAFHIRRIDPVLVAGTPKMKVVMDRVSKTLVESLLREQLAVDDENVNIHCEAVKKCTIEESKTHLLFVMNPTRVKQVQQVADEKLIMPHKSTYFYPKVMTGLLFNQQIQGEDVDRLG